MVTLARYGGRGDPPAMHWRVPSIERFQALVTCANGHTTTLRQHQIGDDGTVSPSVACPLCQWHEWVRLANWRRQT